MNREDQTFKDEGGLQEAHSKDAPSSKNQDLPFKRSETITEAMMRAMTKYAKALQNLKDS